MDKDKQYEFMGKLALALFSQDIKLSFGSLKEILRYQGVEVGGETGKGDVGTGSRVSAAYNWWGRQPKERGLVIQHAILFTYTRQDGSIPWDKDGNYSSDK